MRLDISGGLKTDISTQTEGPFSPVFYNGIVEPGGVNKRRPGDTEFADSGTAQRVHGLFYWDTENILLMVVNGQIHTVTEGGTVTAITGDYLLPDKPVSFATDGYQVVMANGGQLVKYGRNSATSSYIADSDAPQDATQIVYIAGLWVANSSGERAFFHSNANDPETWDSGDFYTTETNPDFIEKLMSINGNLAVIGRDSIEFWKPTGTPSFTFLTARQTGTEAGNSVVQIDSSFLYLDKYRNIVDEKGSVISKDIAPTLSSMADVSDAFAYYSTHNGVSEYNLLFPNEDRSFAFNLTSGTWSEKSEFSNTHSMYKGLCYANCRKWNKHIIGHKSNGKLYELDADTYDTDGSIILFKKQFLNIEGGTERRKNVQYVLFKCLMGAGETGDSTTSPEIIVKYRIDNGFWTDPIHLTLYELGNEAWGAKLRPLRAFKSLDLEVVVSDDTNFQLSAIELGV